MAFATFTQATASNRRRNPVTDASPLRRDVFRERENVFRSHRHFLGKGERHDVSVLHARISRKGQRNGYRGRIHRGGIDFRGKRKVYRRDVERDLSVFETEIRARNHGHGIEFGIPRVSEKADYGKGGSQNRGRARSRKTAYGTRGRRIFRASARRWAFWRIRRPGCRRHGFGMLRNRFFLRLSHNGKVRNALRT